jgi:hypothetical protein
MAKQTINIGTSANDGTGDPLRSAMDKANDNFTELYNGAGGVADGAITTAKLAADAVDSDKIADGSIDTVHIADSQITNAKMADDAVDSAEIVDGAIDTVHIADDNITFAKLEDRYTALSALGSGTSFSLDFSAATTFTATASGNATFTFSNAVQGQVIDLILTGNFTITFSETGSTFNLVGTTAYDGSTNNLIQIVCTDDSSGSKIYHYSVAAYASDPTP